jgi:8-oxo-dGTP pyrophosphatase MutT (NUDIX family)
MDDFYAGIFIIDLSDWKVLAGQHHKYPRDLKALGGKSKLGGKPESPLETAIREAWEEGRTRVLKATLVFIEEVDGRCGKHTRFFFFADQISEALPKEAIWIENKKDEEDEEDEDDEKDGRNIVEKLTTRWVPIIEFSGKLFSKQHEAFGAVLSLLACRHKELLRSKGFCNLMVRFPEPLNLRLDLKIESG